MERLVSLTEQLIADLRQHRKKMELKDIPRMLVIEDDASDAYLICRTLSAMGAIVDVAYDGEDAITKIRDAYSGLRLPYLIVFLDLKLPKIAGVDVLKQLRELIPETPVIVVTGAVYQSLDLEEASKLGYFGLIQKPLAKADVAEILAKHRIYIDPESETPNQTKERGSQD